MTQIPTMIRAILPGGVKTQPYEYRGAIPRQRRNDILIWLEEQERKDNARSRPNSKIGP